jgi:hypothetical protein
MTIYCDESGGIGAGVMTLASVALPPDDAAAILDRVRAVIGLRGELKGSRIEMAERAFVVELLFRMGGRAIVATAAMPVLRAAHGANMPEDIAIYASLLGAAVDPWIAASGGCISVEIDDGRYDPRLNGLLRAEVQAGLGNWGQARLADSKRSPGVQLADVLANSVYQLGLGSPRSARIDALLAPFITAGMLRTVAVDYIDGHSGHGTAGLPDGQPS